MRDFQFPGRSAVFAPTGMCATSNPFATSAALDILKAGGNAVDAAIAGAVLQGLCQPAMTGLGGDCFILFKPAGGEKIIALNGSGRAPAATDADRLRAAGHSKMPKDAIERVTVPGAVDAFCRLSQDYGSMDLARVFAPAIGYARTGLPVMPRAALDWRLAADQLIGRAREVYLLDDQPLKAGDLFHNPAMADVLELIAQQGRAGFYEGDVADDMVRSLRALGGVHTLDDFAKTESTYSEPISGCYRGTDLVEHPPNGQGATAILMNNILAHFDIAALAPLGAQRAHIEAEACKLAYDARNRFLADPDYSSRLAHMMSLETAAGLAALIDPMRAMTNPSILSEDVHRETIHITVVDKDRNVVSLIYSVFHAFGSGLASDKYGINFHNRGLSFSLERGHPNELGPNKRPMHTIIPAMLRKTGKVTMSFGVMGGAYQANGHARFMSNLLDFGMSPQDAIDAPRCFSDAGTFKIERGYAPDVVSELADLGHRIEIAKMPIGGAQAIGINPKTGMLQGGSDPRKDGMALGY